MYIYEMEVNFKFYYFYYLKYIFEVIRFCFLFKEYLFYSKKLKFVE